jgi:hypothetical protein
LRNWWKVRKGRNGWKLRNWWKVRKGRNGWKVRNGWKLRNWFGIEERVKSEEREEREERWKLRNGWKGWILRM